TAQARLERVLVVGNRDTLIGGQDAPSRVGAHAIQRCVARVEAHLGIAASDLLRGIDLGERASGNQRVGWFDALPPRGIARSRAELAGLCRIERKLGRHRFGARELGGGRVGDLRNALRGTTGGRACRRSRGAFVGGGRTGRR